MVRVLQRLRAFWRRAVVRNEPGMPKSDFDFDDFRIQMETDAHLPTRELFELPDRRLLNALQTRLTAKEKRQPLSESELTIVCVMGVFAQVNNGGFHQFFFNSSGAHATETSAALHRAGFAAAAELCERALRAFPGTPERGIVARREQMQAVTEETEKAWSDLDREFYCSSEPDFDGRLAHYARREAKNISP